MSDICRRVMSGLYICAYAHHSLECEVLGTLLFLVDSVPHTHIYTHTHNRIYATAAPGPTRVTVDHSVFCMPYFMFDSIVFDFRYLL